MKNNKLFTSSPNINFNSNYYVCTKETIDFCTSSLVISCFMIEMKVSFSKDTHFECKVIK